MSKPLLFNLSCQKICHSLAFLFFLFFIQKSTATTYYVNDNATKGDVYTTAIGKDTNEGTSASSPKLSIRLIYEKAQDGDTIIIDTGNYSDLSDKGELLFAVTKKITFVYPQSTKEVFSKKPLPKNIKANPTEIYLDKDKPVDRETYWQQLQDKKTKKSQ